MNHPKPPNQRLDALCMLALLPLVAAAGLPWWTSHWTALIADAAAIHVTVGAGLIALAAILRRRRGLFIVAALTIGAATGRWVPSGLPSLTAHHVDAETDWILLHANLGTAPDLAALARLVTETRPHAVSLQEVRPTAANTHNASLIGYRRVTGQPRDDTRGVGIWVRKDIKFLQPRTTTLGSVHDQTDRPIASVVLQRDGERLRLIGVHTKRPIGTPAANTQRDELDALAQAYGHDDHVTTVWLGDFNAVPWSPPVKKAAKAAHLKPVRSAHLWAPTWLPRLAAVPGWPAVARHVGLPLDFALVPRPHKAQLTLGSDLGSDHLPLLLRIAHEPTR